MKNPPHSLPAINDLSLVTRLLAKVEVSENGCWIWQGYTDRKGYGQLKYKGKAQWAHRLAYAAFVGTIPAGMTIHHECFCQGCINPKHIRTETRVENSREARYRNASDRRKECSRDSAGSDASDEADCCPI